MRVALLTLAVPIPDHPSIGLYNIAQCQGIINLGHEARIITCAPHIPKCAARISRACARHRLRLHSESRDDVEIRTARVPFAYTRGIRERWTPRAPDLTQLVFTKAVQRAVFHELRAYDPDMIVVHGIFPWSDLAIKYSKIKNIKLVAIEHSGTDVERVVNSQKLRNCYRERAQQFKRVYAVSKRMTQSLQGIGLSNIHHIQNGITHNPVENRPSSQKRGFTILCAGSYIERKGHSYLLKGFASSNLSDARLRLVGEPTPMIQDLIDGLGIRERISIRPEMPQAQLRREMMNADLFALPSSGEAFGLVYAEALSVGTPVLACDDAGVLELPHVRDCSWVVPPRDSDAIRDALHAAANSVSPSSSHKLQLARDWINEHVTWEINAEQILDIGDVCTNNR